MKLSYRDKVIFICAIVIIILVAGFFLFIKPKYQETNSAKSALEKVQSEKQKIEDKINTLPELIEQLKELAKQVETKQADFLTIQDPYLNEQYVYGIAKENGLNVTSIKTEYTSGDELDEYVVDPANIVVFDMVIQADIYEELPQAVRDKYNKVKSSGGGSAVIGITDMTVSYKDGYDLKNLFKFVDAIAENEKTFSVLSISSEEASDEPECEGSVNLALYSIYPLNVEKVMEETDEVVIVTEQPAE